MGSTTPNTTLQPIVVVGAGVLGLSSALKLQARFPDHEIGIVAAEFPSLPVHWRGSDIDGVSDQTGKTVERPSADYASMWAGAHYRPIPRSTRQLEEEYALAIETNDEMKKIAAENDETVCGVAVMGAVELLECPGSVEMGLKVGDAYAGKEDNFRILEEEELRKWDGEGIKGAVKWGCAYTSYCVNVHVYCKYLLKRFQEAGGNIARQRLDSIDAAFDDSVSISLDFKSKMTPLIVNASGRNFDKDPKVKIIRGQTVLVRNQYDRTITRQNHDGSWVFLIPRPGGGGTVVGGTKEIGDEEISARADSRKILLENAVRCFPDFIAKVEDFDVAMDNVGRRPWREGGMRLASEQMGSPTKVVVHAYGSGGRGYEISWGVARSVADIVDTQLQGSRYK